MQATIGKTSRGLVSDVDGPRQSRHRPKRRQEAKRQVQDEASERRERVLRERVTYMLWVMAQAMD
jgi:hypothetical protein